MLVKQSYSDLHVGIQMEYVFISVVLRYSYTEKATAVDAKLMSTLGLYIH